jgi:hypothetical protein
VAARAAVLVVGVRVDARVRRGAIGGRAGRTLALATHAALGARTSVAAGSTIARVARQVDARAIAIEVSTVACKRAGAALADGPRVGEGRRASVAAGSTIARVARQVDARAIAIDVSAVARKRAGAALADGLRVGKGRRAGVAAVCAVVPIAGRVDAGAATPEKRRDASRGARGRQHPTPRKSASSPSRWRRTRRSCWATGCLSRSPRRVLRRRSVRSRTGKRRRRTRRRRSHRTRPAPSH